MLEEGENALPDQEQKLLDRICDAYYLPAWCSIADYERLMQESGMQVLWRGFHVDNVLAQRRAHPWTVWNTATLCSQTDGVTMFWCQTLGCPDQHAVPSRNAGHQDRGLVQRGVALLAGRHPVGLLCKGRQRAAAGWLDHHQGAHVTCKCA